jgi:hypothetical protein
MMAKRAWLKGSRPFIAPLHNLLIYLYYYSLGFKGCQDNIKRCRENEEMIMFKLVWYIGVVRRLYVSVLADLKTIGPAPLRPRAVA